MNETRDDDDALDRLEGTISSIDMLPRIARRVLALRSPALRRPSREIASSLARGIHTSEHRRDDKKNEKTENEAQKSLVLHAFENADQKEKKAYLDILREYKSNNASRRGHVQFIRAAIKYMDDFGVNRDLEVYKALLDVLPKGKFVPTHYIQTLFVHYPEQQYVAVELLGKMEHNCVMPDLEVQEMLLNIFGQHGLPLKKFWRMMYWMPKFANLNPWPCRRPAPTDPRVLARLAMKKISSVDVRTKITEYETKDVEDSIEDTWIVSAMSSLQEELLQTQSPNSPIFVEGPYLVWVADQCIDYFMLRGNTKKEEDTYEDPDGKRIYNISQRYYINNIYRYRTIIL